MASRHTSPSPALLTHILHVAGSTYKLDRGIGKVMPVPRVQEKQLQVSVYLH